jgi:hypothetical protein
MKLVLFKRTAREVKLNLKIVLTYYTPAQENIAFFRNVSDFE